MGVLWPRDFEQYLNGILICLGFCVPFNGIEWYFKLPLRVPPSPTEIALNGPMVLDDTEWYSMIFSGISLALS